MEPFTMIFFLIAVRLRGLDAQHSRLSATPPAHHQRHHERGYDAENLSRRQRDSQWDGYHVAAEQAVHRLCKSISLHLNPISDPCPPSPLPY